MQARRSSGSKRRKSKTNKNRRRSSNNENTRTRDEPTSSHESHEETDHVAPLESMGGGAAPAQQGQRKKREHRPSLAVTSIQEQLEQLKSRYKSALVRDMQQPNWEAMLNAVDEYVHSGVNQQLLHENSVGQLLKRQTEEWLREQREALSEKQRAFATLKDMQGKIDFHLRFLQSAQRSGNSLDVRRFYKIVHDLLVEFQPLLQLTQAGQVYMKSVTASMRVAHEHMVEKGRVLGAEIREVRGLMEEVEQLLDRKALDMLPGYWERVDMRVRELITDQGKLVERDTKELLDDFRALEARFDDAVGLDVYAELKTMGLETWYAAGGHFHVVEDHVDIADVAKPRASLQLQPSTVALLEDLERRDNSGSDTDEDDELKVDE